MTMVPEDLSPSLPAKSQAMQEVVGLIRRIADSHANILISGENGTGKELVAKVIHQNSGRRNGPFVAFYCGSIPELMLERELFGYIEGVFLNAKAENCGLLEQADGGTIFLDEINEIPLPLQAQLFGAIQEQQVCRMGTTRKVSINVRFVTGTLVDLLQEVKARRFREDLFYRLNVVEIRHPALRERREDIPYLIQDYLQKCSAAIHKKISGVSNPALACLLDYHWPGNERELENATERAAILAEGNMISLQDLPEIIGKIHSVGQIIEDSGQKQLTLREVEEAYIRHILDKTGGNKYQTAHILGIDRKTLYRKIEGMGQQD